MYLYREIQSPRSRSAGRACETCTGTEGFVFTLYRYTNSQYPVYYLVEIKQRSLQLHTVFSHFFVFIFCFLSLSNVNENTKSTSNTFQIPTNSKVTVVKTEKKFFRRHSHKVFILHFGCSGYIHNMFCLFCLCFTNQSVWLYTEARELPREILLSQSKARICLYCHNS